MQNIKSETSARRGEHEISTMAAMEDTLTEARPAAAAFRSHSPLARTPATPRCSCPTVHPWASARDPRGN